MKIKIISLVFLLSGMNLTCNDKPDMQTFSEVTYEASTRGFMLRISLTRDLLTVESSEENEPRSKKLSGERLIEFNKILSSLDPEILSGLERPSNSSAYDAAPMAYLSVTKDDKTYDSSYFDHGNPPEQIKHLVSALIELADID